jgi:hypothetical protein
LHRAIRKHGASDFTEEHLAYADSQDQLDKAEIEWIHKLLADIPEHGYNLAKGGQRCRRCPTVYVQLKRKTRQRLAEEKAEWIRRTFGLFGILKSQEAKTPQEFLSSMRSDSKSARSRSKKHSRLTEQI